MKQLNVKLLKEFLKQAGDHLRGDWLLVGGTLLPAVGIDSRPTMDIDIVGLGKSERSQNLELMKLAESLGLSVEVINQAAAFFLEKIKYHSSDLIVLHRGKTAVLHRPSVFLYWSLKLNRGTESDFSDCKNYLSYCRSQKDPMDKTKLRGLLKIKSKEVKDETHRESLNSLIHLLNN